MSKRFFTSFELAIVSMFATLDFVLFFTVESIARIPPIPILVAVAFLNTMCRFIADRFGTITLTYTIVAILSTPFPVFGGVSGPQKILAALATGLVTDTVLSLLKARSRVFRGIAYGVVDPLVMTPTLTAVNFYIAGFAFAGELLKSWISILLLVTILIEVTGGILAAVLYEKKIAVLLKKD